MIKTNTMGNKRKHTLLGYFYNVHSVKTEKAARELLKSQDWEQTETYWDKMTCRFIGKSGSVSIYKYLGINPEYVFFDETQKKIEAEVERPKEFQYCSPLKARWTDLEVERVQQLTFEHLRACTITTEDGTTVEIPTQESMIELMGWVHHTQEDDKGHEYTYAVLTCNGEFKYNGVPLSHVTLNEEDEVCLVTATDEERISPLSYRYIQEHLCVYRNNPDMKKETCYCDNCHSGRTELANELLRYVKP